MGGEMMDKTKEELKKEDIDNFNAKVEEIVDQSSILTKEDALHEINGLLILAVSEQSKAIDSATKGMKALLDKCHDLEMRLAVLESMVLPLLRDMECAGNC
jgi:hypothetical protein